jgi:uncharacterized protein (DUF4213/DUF364 family)
MSILADLISTLDRDAVVRQVHTCVFWTAVISRHCGLASTFHEPHPYHREVRGVGQLQGKSAVKLAEYAYSDNPLEASIGMATINSLLEIGTYQCAEVNAFDVLAREGEGRDIAIVGYFPWIPRLREVARHLWVIEQQPGEGALPPDRAQHILPRADVVGITGASFINHTVEDLLNLSRDSFVVMLGPTAPLSPVLFDWGVDVIAGTQVVDSVQAINSISEGAVFHQIRGKKLVTMTRNSFEVNHECPD